MVTGSEAPFKLELSLEVTICDVIDGKFHFHVRANLNAPKKQRVIRLDR